MPARPSSSSRRAPPAPRPLYRGVDLELSRRVPVMGVPVEFSSNSQAAMEAVEQSFGAWSSTTAPRRLPGRPVRVALIEHDGDESTERASAITWRMPDDQRIIAFTPGSMGFADFRSREVFIYASPALLADRGRFCFSLLEAFVLTVVGMVDRSPLHAGAIARGQAVALLTGPTGSGKSTLVYAALRAGYRLVADDATYIQLRPRTKIWGVPRRVCLLPEARTFFPEVSSLEPAVLANGKTKLLVPIGAERAAPIPISGDRAGLVLLERSAGRVHLEPMASAALLDAMAAELELTSVVFPGMRKAMAHIARGGGWRLRLSPDPQDAIPILSQIFDELDSRPRSRRG